MISKTELIALMRNKCIGWKSSDTQMLLDALGVEMNEEKYRYYYLLDELF